MAPVAPDGNAAWASAELMARFASSRDPELFARLFTRNRGAFLRLIQARLRRVATRLDPQDVLQEVFLRIHQYAHRFRADRSHAFRSWGSRIVWTLVQLDVECRVQG